MDARSILSATVEFLRRKLGDLGLDSNGPKLDLQLRLLDYFGIQSDSQSTDGSFHSNIEPVRTQNVVATQELNPRGPVFTLRDIQDSISIFSGTNSPDISTWLTEFEETALTVNWSDTQKYIYAKQLLQGAAKLYVRSQINIRDWNSLKNSLREEFRQHLSTCEVHQILRNRRLNEGETLLEFLYSLMEIGKNINLDEESIIEYFVEGIPDNRLNKSVLYQSKTVDQLKYNIQIYSKIKGCCTNYKGKDQERTVTWNKNYQPTQQSQEL